MSPIILKPQLPNIFPFFTTSTKFLSSSTPSIRSLTQTLTFSKKSHPLPLLVSLPSYQSSSFHTQGNANLEEEEEEEEEHIIGDCVVFEEGAFEDPYVEHDETLTPNSNIPGPGTRRKPSIEVEAQNLVPEEWKQAQAEINITKKERRRIAQELQYGRKVEKKRNQLVQVRTLEDYLAYKETKLSQLKPLVLDNPVYSLKEAEDEKRSEGEVKESEAVTPSSDRVSPRNPRLAVYGVSMENISEFFNSGHYEPGENNKSDGPRRKLFTKEEKVLLNRRIPDLAVATSDKWLPLHTLAASGEFYLVDGLLKHNVDINTADKQGLTALHRAILGKKQAVLNYLLRESANPLVRDTDGATLMHYAVRTASTQTIKILLLYNVDINLQDNVGLDGWTPLHLAVQAQRTDLVRLLLIKGADKALRNKDGLTPLDLCLYSGRDTRTYELIKLFKESPKPRNM
ncbi:Ankyrin repeat, partial [Dillenia turbinata]